MRRTTLSYTSCLLAVVASACALEKSEDAAEFRQVLPRAEGVRLAGPEASVRSGGNTTSVGPRSELLADGEAAPGSNAFWYSFTRQARDGVNALTARVLGSVWFIVHTEPTRLGADYAEWGPYTDALEPTTWRFRVTRVDASASEYRYEFEGRPKASSSEDAYLAVLSGTGYGPRSPKHGDGTFDIDVDALAVLDLAKHGGEAGVVTVEHDLPPDVTRKLGALPRTIEARASDGAEVWYTVRSEAYEDHTGRLVVESHGDIDPTKTTAAEDVFVVSRWRADGAGRADITIEGGDLPATIPVVRAVECWGSDFSRAHYSDSVGFEPAMGDPTACAYGAHP